MDTRVKLFLVALGILATARLAQGLLRRRRHPLFDSARAAVPTPSTRRLILASFLTLFAELAFIRWISVEVRVFAYFKNLALLLCFLGFGLGCTLATRRYRWLPALQAFLGLLLLVQIPWTGAGLPEGLSQSLAGATDTG